MQDTPYILLIPLHKFGVEVKIPINNNEKGKFIVGRRTDSDVYLNEPSVSAIHCQLEWQLYKSLEGNISISISIYDSSSNGTYINGSRLARKKLCELKDNDCITFSRHKTTTTGEHVNETGYRVSLPSDHVLHQAVSSISSLLKLHPPVHAPPQVEMSSPRLSIPSEAALTAIACTTACTSGGGGGATAAASGGGGGISGVGGGGSGSGGIGVGGGGSGSGSIGVGGSGVACGSGGCELALPSSCVSETAVASVCNTNNVLYHCSDINNTHTHTHTHTYIRG
eukprot:GHVR01087511.1.p1 GENE.GHVR01087511.1~~GHVR01087511.1.p1  ORF type:complete len:290 (+),score=132.15 GHVR01087511.1:25-870(+)